jgi:hypothetical protein
MNFIRSMLGDGTDNNVSSKRVITFLSFILCGVGFVADIMGYKMTPALFESMIYLVIAGLGFTASEKFASKKE